jgi:hypothetical protein
MEDLFLLLLLTSFICLIVGLIKPSAFNRLMKKELTRKNVGLIFGGAFIVFFVLFGITAEPTETEQTAKQEETQPEEIVEKDVDQPTQAETTEVEKEETQPEPQTEPEWVKIIDLTAKDANKQSGTFTLLGGKQKLSYVVSGDEQSEGMCIIYVMDEGKDLMTDGGFPVIMQDGNKSGETLMRKPAGDYYLDLQVGWGSCAVEILELR